MMIVSLALLLAGCTGGPTSAADGTLAPTETITGSAPTEPPDGTRTGSRTTARPFADCTESPPETVNPDRANVTPGPLPERPDELTERSVERYAAAYERAYKRNQGLTAATETYEVSVGETAVRTVEGGYVVEVNARFWYDERPLVTATPTATPDHYDGPYYAAAYYVADAGVKRDSTFPHGELDPLNGTTVECWR